MMRGEEALGEEEPPGGRPTDGLKISEEVASGESSRARARLAARRATARWSSDIARDENEKREIGYGCVHAYSRTHDT